MEISTIAEAMSELHEVRKANIAAFESVIGLLNNVKLDMSIDTEMAHKLTYYSKIDSIIGYIKGHLGNS